MFGACVAKANFKVQHRICRKEGIVEGGRSSVSRNAPCERKSRGGTIKAHSSPQKEKRRSLIRPRSISLPSHTSFTTSSTPSLLRRSHTDLIPTYLHPTLHHAASELPRVDRRHYCGCLPPADGVPLFWLCLHRDQVSLILGRSSRTKLMIHATHTRVVDGHLTEA